MYLHRDHLGSVVAITDGQGLIKEKRHFDAWGNLAKLQDGAGNALSSFTYLQRGYTGHEHLQTVGLIHMNGQLYDPVLHRFLMPDNYVQDPSNTQNFNRYAYVLNNPLRFTDPSGELRKADFERIVNDLWAKGGGTWHADTGPIPFTNDEALDWGISYMNDFSAWGGGAGWAGSPTEAIRNYIALSMTPEMVTGFYNQQWAGQRFNIIAGYAPGSNGFNIGFTTDPVATMENAVIQYTSLERMAELMGMRGNDNSGNSGWGQNILDILGSSEIPVVSQLADLSSGFVSLVKGDYLGAVLSFGGMVVPGLSQMKLGMKAAKTRTSLVKTGTQWSKHSLQRLAERGVTKDMAEMAISKGQKFYDPLNKSINYVLPNGYASGKSLLVGTNPLTGEVTTVIRSSKNLINKRFILIK